MAVSYVHLIYVVLWTSATKLSFYLSTMSQELKIGHATLEHIHYPAAWLFIQNGYSQMFLTSAKTLLFPNKEQFCSVLKK